MRMERIRKLLLLVGVSAFAVQAQTAWDHGTLMQTPQLAAELQSGDHPPVVIFVGFPVLYRSAHIPNAVFAGPCSTPQGIAALKKAVVKLEHSRNIVLYCGCCPLVKCPNVRPAYQALREMGFSHVQVLELDTNFHTDWVAKNYPTQKGG
jgi:thiosulfate/3-mercaptopyruvate sulfurtransferase